MEPRESIVRRLAQRWGWKLMWIPPWMPPWAVYLNARRGPYRWGANLHNWGLR